MTRETKIGLLVGLGFIVVFAVLLSHNGSGPSPTQSFPPIAGNNTDSSRQGGAALTAGSIGNPEGHPTPAVDSSGSGPELRDPITGIAAAPDNGSDLPSPGAFSNLGMVASGSSADRAEPADIVESLDSGQPAGVKDTVAMADTPEMSLSGVTRTMPPVVEPPKPQPPVENVRSSTPTETPAPGSTPGSEPPAVASGDTGGSSAGHAMPAPTKPYVVQKGDTLVKITRAVYGKSTPDVITFVEKTNKLKDRHSLREGQTLATPPLPPSMFEERTVSAAGVDMKKVDSLINKPPVSRVAPDSKPDTSKERKAEGGAQKSSNADAPKIGKSSLPVGGPAEFIKIGAERQTDRPTPDNSADQQPAGDKPADGKTDAKAEKTDGKTDKPADSRTEKASKTDSKSTKPADKPKRSDKPGSRFYQVQPNDTFSRIAQRELGSKNRWAEIKQMNKDVDPAKMKPGMKIRIPSRDPLSADLSAKRAAA